MCGRFALNTTPEALLAAFKLLKIIDFPPRFNIAPTQPILAIWDESGRRAARLARWGLVPGWVKDPRDFPLLVNARSETMAEKPAFRTSVRHHRCVVPASGYYEWHTGPGGKKSPHYITLASGAPMALAGLWSTWMGPEGEEIDTAALITVPANADLAHIHDRMPAILVGAESDAWLDVRNTPPGEALALAKPLAQGLVHSHPVSARVNTAANEGEDLIVPVSVEQREAQVAKPPKVKAKIADQLDLF